MTGKIVDSRLLSKSNRKRTSPLSPQSAVRIRSSISAIIHKNNLWKEKGLTLDYHCFSSCACAKAAWWWTPLFYMPRWHFLLINVKGHLHAHTVEKEIYHFLSSPMEESHSVILNYCNTTYPTASDVTAQRALGGGGEGGSPQLEWQLWRKHWMSGTLVE